MDRFIDGISIHFNGADNSLKSNMDRFIDRKYLRNGLLTGV